VEEERGEDIIHCILEKKLNNTFL